MQAGETPAHWIDEKLHGSPSLRRVGADSKKVGGFKNYNSNILLFSESLISDVPGNTAIDPFLM
jgi:hypothetical protein